MRSLTVMVGVPASGKSTLAEAFGTKQGTFVVSSDAIRKRMYGDEAVQGNGADVFAKVYADIDTLMTYGCEHVVFDATNLRKRDRKRAIELARQHGYQCSAVYCMVTLEKALERNQQRDRHVPDEVIKRMFKNLEEPSEAEGFDYVTIY